MHINIGNGHIKGQKHILKLIKTLKKALFKICFGTKTITTGERDGVTRTVGITVKGQVRSSVDGKLLREHLKGREDSAQGTKFLLETSKLIKYHLQRSGR